MFEPAQRFEALRSVFRSSITPGRVAARATISLAVLTCVTVGCEQPTIRETVVPRERSGLTGPEFQLPNSRSAATSGAPRAGGAMAPLSAGDRLLIAMIDRPENTYFLRIQAAPAAIDAVRADFDKILQSLTFSGGRVAWTLPADWTESEGGAMFRLATLRSPSGVEVFVTSLTAGQDVLANVNRWQGQLNLPTLGPNDPLPVQRIKVGDQEVILYDAASTANGSAAASPPSTPPAAGGTGSAPTTGTPPTAPPSPANAGSAVGNGGPGEMPFRFPALGDGWQPLPPSMVASARWERKNDLGELKLEVFKFPTDATFLSMLAIWVERIGAPAPTEETLGSGRSELTVASE